MSPDHYRKVIRLLDALAAVELHRVEAAADVAAAINQCRVGDEIGPWSATLGFSPEVAADPAELRQLLADVFAAGRAHEAQGGRP